MKALRTNIIQHCLELLDQKQATLDSAFKWLSDSAATEQKSTAGDKHDTAKAMMHLEQEKLGQQLKLLLTQKQILIQLKSKTFVSQPKKIELGHLVQTNHGWFFIATFIPAFDFEGISIQPISIQSPLVVKMINGFPNKAIDFQDKTYECIAII